MIVVTCLGAAAGSGAARGWQRTTGFDRPVQHTAPAYSASHAPSATRIAPPKDATRPLCRLKRSTAHAVLAPLANTAVGVFRVHQFAGGLNQDCAAAFDALYAITTHYARMVDPKWFRDTRVVAS